MHRVPHVGSAVLLLFERAIPHNVLLLKLSPKPTSVRIKPEKKTSSSPKKISRVVLRALHTLDTNCQVQAKSREDERAGSWLLYALEESQVVPAQVIHMEITHSGNSKHRELHSFGKTKESSIALPSMRKIKNSSWPQSSPGELPNREGAHAQKTGGSTSSPERKRFEVDFCKKPPFL